MMLRAVAQKVGTGNPPHVRHPGVLRTWVRQHVAAACQCGGRMQARAFTTKLEGGRPCGNIVSMRLGLARSWAWLIGHRPNSFQRSSMCPAHASGFREKDTWCL